MSILRKLCSRFFRDTPLQDKYIAIPLAEKDRSESIDQLAFWCPSKLAERRAQELYSKEPQTIQWLRSISEGEILWDIGANVGTFSLFAAARKVNVIAFEPNAENYLILTRNIDQNGLSKYAKGLCIAPSSKDELNTLFLRKTEPARSGASVGKPTDQTGTTFITGREQGVLCVTGDNLVETMGFKEPTYLKLDVDGHEFEILKGLKNILSSNTLRSISVEIETLHDRPDDVSNYLTMHGFKLVSKEPTSLKENCTTFNVIFEK